MKNELTNKINIGGLLFDNFTMEETIFKIEKRVKNYGGKKTKLVALANQDTISRIKKTSGLNKEQINKNSFLILPDGHSIVVASKILGHPLKERIAGPDLMEKLIKASAVKGYENFLLGAKDEVSKKLASNLLKRFPKLKICGRYSPPFGEFTKSENDKMIKLINKSKADFLWVSFGCPKQEKWIIENIDMINVPLSFGIGAAFDFLSGNLKRAPEVYSKPETRMAFQINSGTGKTMEKIFYRRDYFLFQLL